MLAYRKTDYSLCLCKTKTLLTPSGVHVRYIDMLVVDNSNKQKDKKGFARGVLIPVQDLVPYDDMTLLLTSPSSFSLRGSTMAELQAVRDVICMALVA